MGGAYLYIAGQIFALNCHISVHLPWLYTFHVCCRLFIETLGCYDAIAQSQDFTCSLNQLRTFLLDITKLAYYAWRPSTECEDSPQESPYLNCQSRYFLI